MHFIGRYNSLKDVYRSFGPPQPPFINILGACVVNNKQSETNREIRTNPSERFSIDWKQTVENVNIIFASLFM